MESFCFHPHLPHPLTCFIIFNRMRFILYFNWDNCENLILHNSWPSILVLNLYMLFFIILFNEYLYLTVSNQCHFYPGRLLNISVIHSFPELLSYYVCDISVNRTSLSNLKLLWQCGIFLFAGIIVNLLESASSFKLGDNYVEFAGD